ncbi:melanoma antigen preferentially expressed in tumors-like [Bos taurus]|nr:melanoma antigen preferentially expressed in tumors-like [Bos taurus]XP_059739572.1 melanoma antigen preferentially expressed in tumors-like [Bos taurus]XP_059739573.1 melanoma antigen preferentially expressed in tumors-like [Bos taurus]DAA13111.1 TPA: preferentially expressed antigen in melanoma-like 3-like [Bos taurus]
MDQKITATLFELAAKSLLSSEPIVMHALEKIPGGLFVPLFSTAFLGGHKKILKAMVRVWPFHCLHLGSLKTQESYYDILEAMIDGLPIPPAQNSSSRGHKLRILDLRHRSNCKITCSHVRITFPFCLQSCKYSRHAVRNLENTQHRARCLEIGNSGSEVESAQETMELLVNISLSNTLRAQQFLTFLCNKVEQSSGFLHLCCRDLRINRMSTNRHILQILDLGCINHLEMDQAFLNEIITLFAGMIHLHSLSLSNIPFRSYKGRNFRFFLILLGQLENLQELRLSFFYLRDQLHKLLRVLPPHMDALCLPFCGLSIRDVSFLSQSSQATQLRVLNLNNNNFFSEAYEPFQALLEKVSGTIQRLEINNCMMTDSTLLAIIPTLNQCVHLRVFNFAFNPITMPVLKSLLQRLTSLPRLRHVIYPVPVHCYQEQNFYHSLNRQKLAEVQAQVKAMLHMLHQDHVQWATYSD